MGLMSFIYFVVVFPSHMGSSMKPTIFDHRVATALTNWQRTAREKRKYHKQSETDTPFSSRPATPTHGMSPVHLLHNYHNTFDVDSFYSSPRSINFKNDGRSDQTRGDRHVSNMQNEQGRRFQEPSSTIPTSILST